MPFLPLHRCPPSALLPLLPFTSPSNGPQERARHGERRWWRSRQAAMDGGQERVGRGCWGSQRLQLLLRAQLPAALPSLALVATASTRCRPRRTSLVPPSVSLRTGSGEGPGRRLDAASGPPALQPAGACMLRESRAFLWPPGLSACLSLSAPLAQPHILVLGTPIHPGPRTGPTPARGGSPSRGRCTRPRSRRPAASARSQAPTGPTPRWTRARCSGGWTRSRDTSAWCAPGTQGWGSRAALGALHSWGRCDRAHWLLAVLFLQQAAAPGAWHVFPGE
jgi:hypothetical protein